MNEYLEMWPYFVLAFAISEALLVVREKKNLRLELVAAFGICAVFTVVQHYQENSWAAGNVPIKLALVHFFGVAAPTFIFVSANELLCSFENQLAKHSLLIGITAMTVIAWPYWALSVLCISGIDCV